MRTKRKHLAILVSLTLAVSMGVAPPPSQATQSPVPGVSSPPHDLVYSAVLKPSTNLRAKDLARRANANLPSILRGTKLRPSLPLAYPQAERALPADHPSQELRRTLLGELRQYPRSAAELRSELLETGLFERVDVRLKPVSNQLNFSALDQLSNPSGMNDPGRKQWSLPLIKAEQAWGVTVGRSNIGSIDGGVQPNHPDLAPNILLQASALAEPNAANFAFIFDWNPGNLGTNLPSPYADKNLAIVHGLRVNSLMVGAWQSRESSTPANSSGVIGTCPNCKFSTIRAIGDNNYYAELFSWFSKNSGVTAINLSLSIDMQSLTTTALDQALSKRDTAIIAAAGNHNVDAANPREVQYPASFGSVIAVGASDFGDKRWDERRIASLSNLVLRQPGAGAAFVIDERCNISMPVPYDSAIEWRQQCGSTNDPRVDLFAPGAQMIGAADRIYIQPGRLKRTGELNPGSNLPISNKNHFAAMGLGVGNSGSARTTVSGTPNPTSQMHTLDTNGSSDWEPIFDVGYAKLGTVPINESGFPGLDLTQWGPLTGTSMAAPMVTGTVGLMRSSNPMISVASIRELLRSPAMDTITEHQQGVSGSYKRLNMENAVKHTLGTVREVQQVNRLIPMFSMRSVVAQTFAEDKGGDTGGKLGWEVDEPSGVATIDSWLFTTSTQVATAAITGDLSYTGMQDTNNDFGTEQKTPFKSGITYNTGGALPGYRFTNWGTSSTAEHRASASFYLMSTETKPAWVPANVQLVPLWRLSTQCFEIRKYTYTTSSTERASLTSTGTQGGDTVATCVPNAGRRFWEDGIEGYVFNSQILGTVPLYRVARFAATAETSTVALSTKSDDDIAAFSGLSDHPVPGGSAVLGYVFPASIAPGSTPRTLIDTDGDGLEDQFEIVMGLNEQLADSDCDALADGYEFPLNAFSPSDPMTITAHCFDARTQSVQRVAGSTPTIEVALRNVGPSNSVAYNLGNEVSIFFESASTVMFPSTQPSVCRVVDNRISVPPFRIWYACETGALSPSLASSWLGNFAITNGSTTDLIVKIDIPTINDDVPGNNFRSIAVP